MLVQLQNVTFEVFLVLSSTKHHLYFQCPSRYQEEMITNTSDRGQHVQPTERDLVTLHKKVVNTVFIYLYSNPQGNYTKYCACSCVLGHFCSSETQSDPGSVVCFARGGLSSRRCNQKPERFWTTFHPRLLLSTAPQLGPQVLLLSYCWWVHSVSRNHWY